MNMHWDWRPNEFSPPFTVRYIDGLRTRSEDVVAIMAHAPRLGDKDHKWYVVSITDVPKEQQSTAGEALKLLVEQRWYSEMQQQENQP